MLIEKKESPFNKRPANSTSQINLELVEIDIDTIQNPAFHDRQHYEEGDVEKLVISIKKVGLQNPIVVSKNPDGSFKRISGALRLEACKRLGYKTIAAFVFKPKKMGDTTFAMLSENIHRTDLNAYDEIYAYVEYFSGVLNLSHGETVSLINKISNYQSGRTSSLTQDEQDQNELLQNALKELGKYTFNTFKKKMAILTMSGEVLAALKSKKISYTYAEILHTLKKLPDAQKQVLEEAAQGLFGNKKELRIRVDKFLKPDSVQSSKKATISKKGVVKLKLQKKDLSDAQAKLLEDLIASLQDG